MKLLRDLAALDDSFRSGAVTIGNFDGPHRGHARIAQRLVERAAEVGGPAVVFTFDPHPVCLLRPDLAPPPLTWTERKAELLAALGVDAVIAYPTDKALLSLEPQQFFNAIVRQALDARAMVEGTNFYFGHNRTGTIEVLRELTRRSGIVLDVVEPVVVAGEVVSSSRVRRLVGEGRVAEANALLTRPYRIRGQVAQGAGRGAQIGFPTANLSGIDTILPALGVYAGNATLDGRAWPAAIHIGPNPTFGEAAVKVEVHLIGWPGDQQSGGHQPATLYGRQLEVELLARLRGTERFADAAQLSAQLARDVAQVREVVRSIPG